MSDSKQINLGDMLNALKGNLGPEGLNQDFVWYKSFSYPDVPRFSLEDVMSFAEASLFSHALTAGKVVYGHKDMTLLCGKIPDLSEHLKQVVDTYNFSFYLNEDSALACYKLNEHYKATVISLDKQKIDAILKVLLNPKFLQKKIDEQMETQR